MSVLIKGMEMPPNCSECELLYNESFEIWCCLTDREDVFYDAIPDWCPLVALPEKHGRLIDADVLLKIYGDRCEKLSERYGFDSPELGVLCGAGKLLDSQPVVVEAEGEE